MNSSAQDKSAPCVVWFRQDLRTKDNPALRAAADSGKPVICLFILDDQNPGEWSAGGASLWWLHHSLNELSGKLEKAGGALVLRRGDARKIIPDIMESTSADSIFWNRRYAPFDIELDKILKEDLQSGGYDVNTSNGRLLFEPWEVETQSGGPYRVFTPFWKAMQAKGINREPLPEVTRLYGPKSLPNSDALDDWALLPTKPDWAQGFKSEWSPGQSGALTRLKDFLNDAVGSYSDDRNRPDKTGTSGLSPHLHFGEISPLQIWSATQDRLAQEEVPADHAKTFLSEIAWREFSYSLLFYNPKMLDKELNEKFRKFPWVSDREKLKAWQQGQTGYPVVDAGMRQLWQTGWMHNRVRMITGSFLVKHLLIDWREGMKWFWDTLVDADIASNTASWQWIAGCGADAAPYFRIFNPMTQGERFDPSGDYVRKYVPELQKMPKKHIHTPWEADAAVLKEAGVQLGKDYPYPIVDHKPARQAALDAYEKIK
ncbi:deoxyribodipyrimidine photo-lyase [Parvularcula sp. IMCC14364]|uniref:cryptochrome/photolyase family protein n=1 Tax=Parvularcula sp. IMCC14364 TaxID=3067902 RepID=UPI0027423D5E|nr:deoxyribodipyrimidine photo-lyase [Parvularcula sp. IMCC14364]